MVLLRPSGKKATEDKSHWLLKTSHLGVSQNKGYHFGGSYNEDYSVLGSIFGFPNFGNLPSWARDGGSYTGGPKLDIAVCARIDLGERLLTWAKIF